MALFDLYKLINEKELKPATNPLYETKEVEDIIETKEVNEAGEEIINETVVNRKVDVMIINPTEEICREYNYRNIVDGRQPEHEPQAGEGINVTYEEAEVEGVKVILKHQDLFTKQEVQEEKPTEELDEYHFWGAYDYETETEVVHSWKATEKEIQGEKPEYDIDTQYLTYTDDTSAETVVIRTYTVNDKEVITEDIPVRPNPEEPENYWELEEHIDYSQEKVIVKSYTWKTTEERRIALLEVTKREFCMAIKELKGITYSQLMQVVESTEDTKMMWRECIQLLRADQALDEAGKIFGLTHEDINNIFRYIHNEINLDQLKGINTEEA